MVELCNHYIAHCKNMTVPMHENENYFNIVEKKENRNKYQDNKINK